METENVQAGKPQVFLKSITFNDGTQLSLSRNSIIVFAGANNSGKSQTLKDVENYFEGKPTIVITGFEADYCGVVDEPTFFNNRFYKCGDGRYQLFEKQIFGTLGFEKENIQAYWKEHNLKMGLYALFVRRLSTELRLTTSNDLRRDGQAQRNPIYKLHGNETLAQKISDYFRQAFGVDLVVHRREMQTVSLHVGVAPNRSNYNMDKEDEFYNQVSALPKLQEQGDGMRSFASILLDTFTSDYTITLIDEPEAFLHPPQARILGKMLAKSNPEGRQLLISTHSEDFLQGLLDADNENVAVIRIDRTNSINKMNVLKSEDIKRLWGNPLLRYSNILNGLFHEKVVVCESDYDCLFYQAVLNAIYENKGEVAPDVLFTHCGGKDRVKDVVAALKAVNVPVVAICDFDLLDSSQHFKPIATSFGLDWESKIFVDMKVIYDHMNAKGADAWNQIKKVGKSGLGGDAPAAYEKVEIACKSAGLFVVPVGEMECFDKTINKEKKDWVYYVLENYNLATEPKLAAVREFVQETIDYKPAS